MSKRTWQFFPCLLHTVYTYSLWLIRKLSFLKVLEVVLVKTGNSWQQASWQILCLECKRQLFSWMVEVSGSNISLELSTSAKCFSLTLCCEVGCLIPSRKFKDQTYIHIFRECSNWQALLQKAGSGSFSHGMCFSHIFYMFLAVVAWKSRRKVVHWIQPLWDSLLAGSAIPCLVN